MQWKKIEIKKTLVETGLSMFSWLHHILSLLQHCYRWKKIREPNSIPIVKWATTYLLNHKKNSLQNLKKDDSK